MFFFSYVVFKNMNYVIMIGVSACVRVYANDIDGPAAMQGAAAPCLAAPSTKTKRLNDDANQGTDSI